MQIGGPDSSLFSFAWYILYYVIALCTYCFYFTVILCM